MSPRKADRKPAKTPARPRRSRPPARVAPPESLPPAPAPVERVPTGADAREAFAPLHPRDLPPGESEKLVGLMQRIFGTDERAADAAAVDLVDFGPSGAQALLGVMADPEFRKQARGMWALLHALADFLSLEVPQDLQENLVAGAFDFLASLTHNRLGVAWLTADVLAHHLSDTRGPRMLDRLRAGFVACLAAPVPVVQKAAIYGLAAMGDQRSLEELFTAGARLTDPDALAYLARTRTRAEAGAEPEVFAVDGE